MAARVFANYNWTPTLTADTTNLADNTYMAIAGGVASQVVNVTEVYINGMAGTAAPMHLVLARSSTVGTGSALAAPASDGPLNPNATTLGANAVSTYTTSSVNPKRSVSTSLARLNMGINAFGGSYRWNASPTQRWQIIGATGTAGETTLSALSVAGTAGLVGCSIIYEPE
jgi:hypothetical protein